MKAQYFVLVLAAVVTTLVGASPAWSYRWGGYNSFGSGYGYGNGNGLNALRYILPINGYRNYNYGGNGYNNNRNYNLNCGHHHRRRWW